ncbi:hypothetical protein DB347_07025 [Opitutaceae bacterium EW11]|nr:hypothetical protein DB347_07025 [Opitutaceae bacterium EW11]
MKSAAVTSAAAEINRLHADACRFAADSRNALTCALQCAWRAGQLLVAEKKRVQRSMGAGAWLQWLDRNFEGTVRTAQRYMRLAASVSDSAFLRGLSIRQAYLRLGIATEPKSRAETVTVAMLPDYIRLTTRLLRVLRQEAGSRRNPNDSAVLREDLAELYRLLRRLFETANNSTVPVSIRPCAPPDRKIAYAG